VIETARDSRCLVCGGYVRQGVLCPTHREAEVARPVRTTNTASLAGATHTTVEMLDLGLLEVPREYQRPIKEHVVKRIKEEFDPDLVGFLTVGRLAERLLLMDGQHRWLSLVDLGYEKWPCEVLHGIAVARQAAIYSGRNGRRVATSPLDSFRADQVAGAPAALAITATLSRHGYGISQRRRATAHEVVCVNALREIHSWGCLEDTMATARGAWPVDPNATRAEILEGIAAVLRQHAHVSVRELIRCWGRVATVEVMTRAGVRRAGSRDGRSWVHVAAVLVELYNRGRLPANRLPLAEIPLRAARDWKRPAVDRI
jgi:hypothetical protein